MGTLASFDEVLDTIEQWPAEEQADLIDVVRRRLAAKGHERLVGDVKSARAEHAAGLTRVASVDEIMREIGS